MPPSLARLTASISILPSFPTQFRAVGRQPCAIQPGISSEEQGWELESWLPGRWLCLMNFVRRMGFEHSPSMFCNGRGRTWPCWTLSALAAHPGFLPWSWSSSPNKIWIPAWSSSSFLSCCADTQSLTAQPQPLVSSDHGRHGVLARSEGWISSLELILGSLNPSPAL